LSWKDDSVVLDFVKAIEAVWLSVDQDLFIHWFFFFFLFFPHSNLFHSLFSVVIFFVSFLGAAH
jgi:hypothetical protein